MSRRDAVRMSDEEIDSFLSERHVMNVATMRGDGRIHLVAMWYGFVDDKPAFWTYGRSQKIANLQRDPRITCLVEDGEQYDELRGVELSGAARVVDDRDTVLAVGRSVYERYTAPYDESVLPQLEYAAAKRVAVVIDVENITSWDHRKLGGTY
ncbi:MAG TPA: TIGR03618 family F420-dependent PPOX class oxidoreductase [Acidimicrobiales bacterium]|nr:TIGR03618 family F420-dependent PPOX class oxidoreductase [Acidimicrobiales bacterium]